MGKAARSTWLGQIIARVETPGFTSCTRMRLATALSAAAPSKRSAFRFLKNTLSDASGVCACSSKGVKRDLGV